MSKSDFGMMDVMNSIFPMCGNATAASGIISGFEVQKAAGCPATSPDLIVSGRHAA
jgi:hypothetical protein